MAADTLTEIESLISDRSQSYTPEWRFDTDDPDIGSALAIVYARMMEQTVKKLTRIPFKNRVVFLNSLGADLLPAVPSEGFVSMTLVNEDVSSVSVPTKTAVIAESADSPDGMVVFETTDAMCATPAVIHDIISVDGTTDRIEILYDMDKDEEIKPFIPFGSEGVNVQKHEFYFSQDTVLYINKTADIELVFTATGGGSLSQDELVYLADPSRVVYEYASGEDDTWERIRFTEAPYGYIHLRKEEDQPPFFRTEINGKESYWIRMRLAGDRASKQIELGSISISARCREMLPDSIISPEGECSLRRMLPFGERLALYDEVYIGSEEVLSKRGASVTLSFRVDFARVPLDTSERTPFNWEWVMRRSDFKQDIEFDVTIESVIWEYYNGAGWTRLFPDSSYSRIFSVPDDVSGQFQVLKFTVPEDMERALIGAQETFFIRARILKINNLYKQLGNYVLPVVENIGLKYVYSSGKKAQSYRMINNLEEHERGEEETESICPFLSLASKKRMCYFGFDTPPKGSPIKMLFDMTGTGNHVGGRIGWEYLSGKGFRNLNPVDETENLTKTGLLTFTGGDMEKTTLFGKERYWLRLVDVDDMYRSVSRETAPTIRSIHMNTTKAIQVTGRRTEYFRMEIYEKDKSFDLLDRNIYRIHVDVDESGMLDESEEDELKRRGLLEEEYADDGTLIHLWVRWKQVPDFYLSEKNDRHYVVHALEGSFLFGDGMHGRIPSPSAEPNIRVRYQTAGGDYTNLLPEAITHSEYSLGYVNRIYNPLPMTGGSDAEMLGEGVSRNSRAIRHQRRAVVASDYEALARESSRDISMVRCFTGYDEDGEELSGAVTLVVLGRSFGSRSAGFGDLKERIISYMRDRISPLLTPGRRFFVTEPAFVEVRLYLELTVESYELVFDVREKLLERLAEIITPKKRPDGPGFEIGEFPGMMQLQNAINDIDGIVFIRKLVMNTYVAGADDDVEIDVETMKRRRYVLPVNGEHEIVIDANK